MTIRLTKFGSSKSRSGFGLIEVVIGASIITLSFLAIILAFNSTILLSRHNLAVAQANYLLSEGLEAVRYLRNESWANINQLSVNEDYYLVWSGGTWQLSSTPILIDGRFDRKIRLAEVVRDGNGQISESGSIDPDTYQVEVIVDWLSGSATSTKQVTTYLTNLYE